LLDEAFMGFLALVALGAALAPMVFELDATGVRALQIVEWLVVAAFAVDYVVTLMLAPSPWRYAVSAWGLLDLVIIAGPFLSLLPGVGDDLRSTPILRLLRVTRAAAFGARAGGAVVREQEEKKAASEVGPLHVSVLRDERHPPEPCSWSHLLQSLSDTRDAWYHISSIGPEPLVELARKVGMVPSVLEAALADVGYPRVEASSSFSALVVWLPSIRMSNRITVDRLGTLLLTNGRAVITLSRHALELHRMAEETLSRVRLPEAAFPTRMVCAFLRVLLAGNEQVTGELEQELRMLEDIPVRDSSPAFFEQTFRLKKELSAVKADLWRLKGILSSLIDGRVSMPGLGHEQRDFLRVVRDEADYVYETVGNVREAVLSLIDLHLNIVSFDMNRFMKLLAAVSVLGLIPAVVGGLLGMNLVDNPWAVTLPQVAFGVSMAMLLVLYLFLVRGWLR